MNKSSKNKKAILALTTLGITFASSAILFGGQQTTTQTTTQLPNSIKSDIINRSENQNKVTRLTNSEFYFSNFTFLNPDKGETVAIDYNAIKQWTEIKKNLETYSRFSATPSYQYIMNKIKELEEWSNVLITRDALVRVSNRPDIWETIKGSLNWKEFSEIAGSPLLQDELAANIKILSGFVSGQSTNHRIERLVGRPSSVVNLETGVLTPIDIPVYPTEIKIAEFSPSSIAGNVRIDFSFSDKPGMGTAADGSLILRNNNSQFINPDLSQNQKDFEVFGRWNNLGNKPIDNSTNFKAFFDSFVITKAPNGNISVVVRLKQDQIMTNVSINTRKGTVPIDNFGIIDARIDSKPLYDLTDVNNNISNIQFFSNNLDSMQTNGADVGTTVSNSQINSKYEYYVGNNTALNLNLFYRDSVGQYKELYDFIGDEVSETIQQEIKVGIDDLGNPMSLDLSTIQLSSLVIGSIKPTDLTQIENASLYLKTSKSNLPTVSKQELYFNKGVTGLSIEGSPTMGKNGVIIPLDDITQKIFFEMPKDFTALTDKPIVTEARSLEWVNKESEAIAVLSSVYEKWSRGNEIVGVEKLGQAFYNRIDYNKTGSTFKNITWKSQSDNYTGIELYNVLVNEYSSYQKVLNQIVGSKLNNNIFEVGPGGTASSIVSTHIMEIENREQRTAIIQRIKELIDEPGPTDELLIEKELAELIRINFSEMKNRIWDQPINKFYYEEIKKYLDSTLSNNVRISDPATFLNFDATEGLFTLKNSNILETKELLTGTEKMQSLFSLLYFGSNDYDSKLTTYLGNAIFGSLSTSGGSESSLDLFTKVFSKNQSELSSFNSQDFQTMSNTITIYNKLLSSFGFGISAITENSLKTGDVIELKWGNIDFVQAIDIIFNKFNANSKESVVILEKTYEFNKLNSLITSANIYNSLIYRKFNTPEGVVPELDIEKIDGLLASGLIFPTTIFTWSRIQKSGNDINLYTTDFSKNKAASILFANEIKTDKEILDRWITEQKSLFENINPFLNVQMIWPPIVGLIAVGLVVISSVSLFSTRKFSKSVVSSKAIVRAILIITIIVCLASIGVIGAFIVPGLF
ncbi:MAG: hypothetical protein KFW07_00560 [Mycoplasmataceae bacterium]|nr:hypothetical protein [Mycoplasmataceae bacterium]